MKCFKFMILLAVAETAMGGGESTCEPFRSNFHQFFQVFETSLENTQKYSTDASVNNPVLAPVFIHQLECVKTMFLKIASKATSRLSGVDADLIHDALIGTIPLSSLDSLNCIADELSYFKNNFTNINMLIIPYLQSISQQSTASTATCNDIYMALLSYFAPSVSLIVEAGSLISADTASFGNINMDDIYLESMVEVSRCILNMLGVGFGAVMNADGNVVNDYIQGTITTLPVPFNCISYIINYGRDILSQAINSFNTGTPLNLVIPPFPTFNPFA